MSTQGTMLEFDAAMGRKLEMIYRTDDVVARRRAVIDAVQPRPGEHGLDIGPGPGFVACELARLVGDGGSIAVLDNNPAMLAMTRHRAHREGVAQFIEAYEGDGGSLPLPDGSIDFIVAAQIYEYVPDIEGALAEAHRVLRPGGRLAIIDTDWDTLVVKADDAQLQQRVFTAFDEHLAHRTLPRHLPGLLRRAGFDVAGLSLVPVLNLVYDSNYFGHGLIDLIAGYSAGRAGATDDDVAAWRADIERQSSTGAYFFSLNQYVFRSRKPSE